MSPLLTAHTALLLQCRQKTAEVKAKCGKCTLWWCPACLLNRYGERVAEVDFIPGWPCPRCRGDCNCSNCRKVWPVLHANPFDPSFRIILKLSSPRGLPSYSLDNP